MMDLNPQEFAQLLKEHAGDPFFSLIDVRTLPEFSEGHIEGAELIDYYRSDFADRIAQLDRSKTYALYCRSGGRSGMALATFKHLEFGHVFHLARGVLGWREAGLPLV